MIDEIEETHVCARPPRVIFSLNQTPDAKSWSKMAVVTCLSFGYHRHEHMDHWLCQPCHHYGGLSLSPCIPLQRTDILLVKYIYVPVCYKLRLLENK